MAFVARFLGKRLACTYELADLVPGERLVMRTAEGPFPVMRRANRNDLTKLRSILESG